MTRAANGAQRSGAAARIIIFSLRDEVYAHPICYFPSSFFVAPTPAHRYQGRMWAGPGFAGSTVLYGPGGRTAKHLKSNGSMVLFRTLTRDARADMRAHAYRENDQNHRTQNSNNKSYLFQWFSGSTPVLSFAPGSGASSQAVETSRFSGSAGNKQWGGYCLTAFAEPSSAYPGLNRRAAPRNFRGRARLVAGARVEIGADRGMCGLAGKNGGFPPFFEVAPGRVGMPMSERREKTAVFCGFQPARLKPARLSAPAAWAGPAALVDPRGGDIRRRGGTPPIPRVTSSCSLAQPIFWISSQFQIRWHVQTGVVIEDGRLSSSARTGSGVSILILAALTGGAEAAKSKWAGLVGEDRLVLGWGRSRTSTLWGEVPHVN